MTEKELDTLQWALDFMSRYEKKHKTKEIPPWELEDEE